ncbi:hypothetical protein [Streptomyces youssoufiensis]
MGPDEAGEEPTGSGPTSPESIGSEPIDWAALREAAARRRARRRVVGGAVAVALVATASVGVWLLSGDDEEPPARHTAELPTGFGAYRLADEGDSVWQRIGWQENRDPTTKPARVTYRNTDKRKALAITLRLDPSIDVSDPTEDEDAVSQILGIRVASDEVKSYDPGPIGGTLRCVRYEVADTTSARCVWGNDAASVTVQPVVTSGPRPTVGQTARETRSFLDELRLREVE